MNSSCLRRSRESFPAAALSKYGLVLTFSKMGWFSHLEGRRLAGSGGREKGVQQLWQVEARSSLPTWTCHSRRQAT
eukprot:CAMPEP_0204538638 /NCGR_PEP_ID=MMETSP0661-20131031/16159_1 /ASSEMBLY_ACC=CAM_ASM_000606 /TAXON_ID=109239 /ORGANISM="Alexandrium margalefi, Strain AMGDE01CS-322" /LENGTH=75 /DNA_ID=CAMNT_0051545229 /DNA_START=187 /DNA_END=410 /DNA_ORIENTATION=+